MPPASLPLHSPRRPAVATISLQAINLLQQGATSKTDRILSLLGFRHRLAASTFLHPQTLKAALAPQPQPGAALASTALQLLQPSPEAQPLPGVLAGLASRPPAMPPLVLDAALDPALLAALQRGFRPSAAFWREHGYWGTGCGFFSYVFPLAGPALHPVEAAILQLRQRLLQLDGGGEGGAEVNALAAPPAAAAAAVAAGGPGGSGDSGVDGRGSSEEVAVRVRRATHAEWWVHCRDARAPHQLHFDVGTWASPAPAIELPP